MTEPENMGPSVGKDIGPVVTDVEQSVFLESECQQSLVFLFKGQVHNFSSSLKEVFL